MRKGLMAVAAVLVLAALACTPPPPESSAEVFVVAQDLGSVLRIDPVTYDSETIDLQASTITSIAVVGDDLWYAWGGTGGTVGRYNLETGQNDPRLISSLVYDGIIKSSPTDPDVLFVGEMGLSPSNITRYDISGSSPVQVARTEHGPLGSNLGDFEVSPDGGLLWVASGAPYQIVELRATDLTLTGKVFPTGSYPTGVAETEVGGTTRLVGGTNSAHGTDLHAFESSNPATRESFETGASAIAGNVAVAPDAGRAYAAHQPHHVSPGGPGHLATVDLVTGAVTTVDFASSPNFNGGIDVDPGTGRVFVATHNSISVFGPAGDLIHTIPDIAGPSTVLVVPDADEATPHIL